MQYFLYTFKPAVHRNIVPHRNICTALPSRSVTRKIYVHIFATFCRSVETTIRRNADTSQTSSPGLYSACPSYMAAYVSLTLVPGMSSSVPCLAYTWITPLRSCSCRLHDCQGGKKRGSRPIPGASKSSACHRLTSGKFHPREMRPLSHIDDIHMTDIDDIHMSHIEDIHIVHLLSQDTVAVGHRSLLSILYLRTVAVRTTEAPPPPPPAGPTDLIFV
jgi:hypothetical protein